MIPFILAAVGGYLIADSMKSSQKFADGGETKRIKTIKESDIQVGRKFQLMDGEVIEIKRLFVENIDQDWVEYVFNGETKETSVNHLKNFINNWRPYIMAKGGMTEHGLQSGDKIIDTTYYDENTINVINDGKYAAVNLDKGERMEGIYANGGETNQEYNVTIRYPSDNQKSGWASFDHIDIRVTATSRDSARAKALKEFKKLHPNKNGTVGNVNNMKPSDFDSLFNQKMANGGKVDMPYILWVSKDGEKRKIHSTHKSQNEAEKEMKKLWENSDFKAMGNKLKIEYDKEGLVLGYPESRIMANGGEIEKAAKFKADNPNWTNEKLLAEYNKLKFDLSEFNAGNIKPSKVIGGGYKSSAIARKLAKKWLEDKVAEYKMALEIRGVMANGGVMSRGGESHSDQMIDIMNRDREQEMGRRMKFQESTLEEDMEEARGIFGKYWDTLTEKEKIEATKYLKIKGEVGHFGREDDDVQTFMNDLNYKRGGRTNE